MYGTDHNIGASGCLRAYQGVPTGFLAARFRRRFSRQVDQAIEKCQKVRINIRKIDTDSTTGMI